MIEMLTPQEEFVLNVIKEEWKQKRKIAIKQVHEITTKKGQSWKYEWVRQIVGSLLRKGEILVDIKGNERFVRPNHVSINSKVQPKSFRNFTVVDPDTEMPVSRIWTSIYENGGKKYLVLSESKWDGKWKTTSNIVVPPDAMEEFMQLCRFVINEGDKK